MFFEGRDKVYRVDSVPRKTIYPHLKKWMVYPWSKKSETASLQLIRAKQNNFWFGPLRPGLIGFRRESDSKSSHVSGYI